MHATTIVGYTFNADTYCPEHIITALPTGKGERYDGWNLAPGVRMTTEDNLNELAYAFGIDRTDESTFDTEEFPKVIFASTPDVDEDTCAVCHQPLT